jgi:cytochrome c oxidase subunit 2
VTRAASACVQRASARAQSHAGGCLRLFVAAWALASAGLVVAAPSAFAFRITPESGGSPNANSIHTIYVFTLVFALVIFVLVEGALAYALLRYRARKGAVAAQIRGNTRLEVGWTVGAAAVLVVLAVFTFVKLASVIDPQSSGPEGERLLGDNGALYATAERHLPPSGKSLEINIVGRQYVWQFVYPGGVGRERFAAPYSYQELVVPTETTVLLDVVSVDVVHSWWVPNLGGKVQAVPGYHSYTWFKISKPGVFHGQCANLCGRGHARMIATVRAVPPPQFEAWLAERTRLIAEANAEAAKARTKLGSHTGAESVEHP